MFTRICKRLSTTNNTHQLFTRFTALPVVTPALVKNEFCGVVTLVNVGVMPVTTPVEPGVPLTSPTTPVKVGVTLVTHVAPDAGDTSAVLRLPTVSAARSAWFEADANSANRTAVRRGTMVRFGLLIPRPPESALVLIIAQTVWQIRVKRIDCRAFGRLCRGCCKTATIFTNVHAGEHECTMAAARCAAVILSSEAKESGDIPRAGWDRQRRRARGSAILSWRGARNGKNKRNSRAYLTRGWTLLAHSGLRPIRWRRRR